MVPYHLFFEIISCHNALMIQIMVNKDIYILPHTTCSFGLHTQCIGMEQFHHQYAAQPGAPNGTDFAKYLFCGHCQLIVKIYRTDHEFVLV